MVRKSSALATESGPELGTMKNDLTNSHQNCRAELENLGRSTCPKLLLWAGNRAYLKGNHLCRLTNLHLNMKHIHIVKNTSLWTISGQMSCTGGGVSVSFTARDFRSNQDKKLVSLMRLLPSVHLHSNTTYHSVRLHAQYYFPLSTIMTISCAHCIAQ